MSPFICPHTPESYNNYKDIYHSSQQLFYKQSVLENEDLNNQRDHLERTYLIKAVEDNEPGFANFLLDCGANVNAVEGCGLTPLTHAVLKNNIYMVSMLLDRGAAHKGN